MVDVNIVGRGLHSQLEAYDTKPRRTSHTPLTPFNFLEMNRKQDLIDAKQGRQLPGPSDRIAGLLAAAQRYHQAGELAEAERGYRKILAADRKHIGSIDLLGIVANNRGNVLKQQGKLDDAVVQYDPGIARLTE